MILCSTTSYFFIPNRIHPSCSSAGLVLCSQERPPGGFLLLQRELPVVARLTGQPVTFHRSKNKSELTKKKTNTDCVGIHLEILHLSHTGRASRRFKSGVVKLASGCLGCFSGDRQSQETVCRAAVGHRLHPRGAEGQSHWAHVLQRHRWSSGGHWSRGLTHTSIHFFFSLLFSLLTMGCYSFTQTPSIPSGQLELGQHSADVSDALRRTLSQCSPGACLLIHSSVGGKKNPGLTVVFVDLRSEPLRETTRWPAKEPWRCSPKPTSCDSWPRATAASLCIPRPSTTWWDGHISKDTPLPCSRKQLNFENLSDITH